jgi:Activator of Hsp90 ATPase homolog 1-like protein
MPTTTLPEIEDLTLKVNQEIRVQAPIEVTFDALLEQLGPSNERPDGTSLELKLEAWPGGRWFRDLGDGNGHFWATVQAIKRPTLLELNGPMFMSYPVTNNVQYRLSEEDGETVIRFCHAGFGLIQEEHRQNVGKGWSFIHDQVRKRAEGSKGSAATRK